MKSVNKYLKVYNTKSCHDVVMLSFTLNGYEYIATLNAIRPSWCLMEKDSKGYQKIRMSLTVNQKRKLALRAECIGKTEEIFTKCQYNKGEQIERYLLERLTGKEWKRNTTPWYKGCDIVANGQRIEVKRENATICSLASLLKASK